MHSFPVLSFWFSLGPGLECVLGYISDLETDSTDLIQVRVLDQGCLDKDFCRFVCFSPLMEGGSYRHDWMRGNGGKG